MNISFLKEQAVRQLSASELRELADLKELRLKEIPIPRESPDFAKLIQMVTAHINEIAVEGADHDDDAEHYIYENAVEAIYKEDVWSWINEMKER